jgi:23S rRNA (cytidine1920-2'-O)/16S rRNA (cytidine1409-2'-O)-methyltransferase
MSKPTVEKERLDVLLLNRGLTSSREKAQALILAGQVLVNDSPAIKAGERVPVDADIRIRGEGSKYVGRGGDKLEGALRHFAVQVEGRVAIDVGASTGGFSDCLLQHGAQKIYAIDVGYNQLDHKLRSDARVVVWEKTHARDLPDKVFDPRPNLGVIDVSFISVRSVLDWVVPVFDTPFDLIVLVKPQFELGREHVGKGGVVREEAQQLEAVRLVREHGKQLGLRDLGAVPSVLKGGKKGNQEYFLCFTNSGIVE